MAKKKPEKRTLRVPTGPILSRYLRTLALEVETIDPEGEPLNKAAVLAQLVWKYALGFIAPADPKDPDKGELVHPPATWAIDLLYNRIEGKIPVAVVEDQGRSLTEKVSDLGKAKANAMAAAAAEEEESDG